METNALTILVVDDTEARRCAVAQALCRDGFHVVEAACGRQVLELAKQHSDLILLNIKLPDLDGQEVCRRLKSNTATADIPVILFSPHSVDAESRMQALECGADDYIADSASTEELVFRMGVWARVRRAEAELKRKNKELADLELRLRANCEVQDSKGDMSMAVLTVEDIERKRAEEALRHSEERYRTLFENMVEGFFLAEVICDEHGEPVDYRYLDANPAFEPLTGLKLENVIGRTAREVLPGIEEHWIKAYGRVALTGEAVRISDFAGPLGRHYETMAYSPRPGHVACLFSDITERKRAEQALRDSEERFRVAQELSPDGFLIFRPLRDDTGAVTDFLWIYENDAAGRMNNTNPKDVCGKRVSEVLPHHHKSVFHKLYKEVAETGEVRIVEEAFYDQDTFQQRTWFRVAAVPTTGGDVAILVQDVTERKRAEEALREREAQFRTLANAIPTLCWMANADGWIFWYNERWYEYTGTTPEQMEGWGWESVHDPAMLPEVLRRWKASIAKAEPFEMVFPLRGADGVLRPFLTRIVPIKDSDGRVFRWFGTNTDVTELREAQDALRRSEAHFRATVENIPQMVWVAGRSAGFRYLSPKWLAYTGTINEQNASECWADAVHPEDREQAQERWNTAVSTNGVYEAEYRLRRHDGEYRWHFSRAVPIAGSEQGEPLWFGTTTDVQDQKRTQELLIRSEKVAALGRMAAALAHDINNPLAAAMNALFLARTANGPDREFDDYLQTVDEELRRISHITRQALGFYRETSKSAPVAVDTIMDEAVAILRSKLKVKRIQVETSYKPDCEAIGNAGELRQVFCNLLANSVDALDDNGTVRLRVSANRDPKTGNPRVRITVADDGAGIDRKFMSRLFEPLFSTKGSVGTGLGLWVSRQLIEKHGGSIRVRSATNGSHRGTSFSILLPASTALLTASAASASTAAGVTPLPAGEGASHI